MKLTTLFSQSNLCLCLPHDDDTDTLLVPIGLIIYCCLTGVWTEIIDLEMCRVPDRLFSKGNEAANVIDE